MRLVSKKNHLLLVTPKGLSLVHVQLDLSTSSQSCQPHLCQRSLLQAFKTSSSPASPYLSFSSLVSVPFNHVFTTSTSLLVPNSRDTAAEGDCVVSIVGTIICNVSSPFHLTSEPFWAAENRPGLYSCVQLCCQQCFS